MHPDYGGASADDAKGADQRREEPEGFTQQDQRNRVREEGQHQDVGLDMSEEEEARILEAEFGPPEPPYGIYRAKEGETP